MAAVESRKRVLDDADNNGEAPKRTRGSEPLLKMLVPSMMCGHVLGKGGCYVKELRTAYGGHVGFSDAKQFYPGTEERICLITGTIKQVTDISCAILDRLSEHEEKRTRILVTGKCAGIILGKGGATIKQIQEETGVKMVLGTNGTNERPVTMTGTLLQRIDAIIQIITKVAEEPSNMANTKLNYDTERILDKVQPNHRGPFGPVEYPQQVLRPPMGVAPMGVGLMGGPQYNGGKRPRLNVLPSTVELTIDVPRQMVGYIMGKGGQGIKDLTRGSKGAHFRFDDFTVPTEGDEGSRKLTVKGNIDQVAVAYDLVHDKVDEYTNFTQQYPPQSQRNM